MESEVSLPCSQEPATTRYCKSICLFHMLFSISFHLCLCLPSGHLPSGLPSKLLYALIMAQCVLHIRPSNDSKFRPPTGVHKLLHEAASYIHASRILPFPLSYVQLFSSAPYTQIPSLKLNSFLRVRNQVLYPSTFISTDNHYSRGLISNVNTDENILLQHTYTHTHRHTHVSMKHIAQPKRQLSSCSPTAKQHI
jgi:hypothetical protein